MNPAQTLDINQCIKVIEHWGSTDYVNICTGALVSVPWGEMTYLKPVIFVAVLAVVGLATYLILSRDSANWRA